jgi:UDP-GlcNAc:undecaprenyl-phosphate/decaprenyl-phosphate GlcNAc-1-phosphate transferase
MDNIIFSGALAFLITFFSIPIIIQVAREKKLFDEPDERKVHKTVIPTLGGLGIFAGFILATLLGAPALDSKELQYFAASAIVIFFLGIKDDILVLSVTKKFIGQLVAAGIIIKFGGIQITNMHGFLGVGEIPHIAGIVLTLFTVIVIVNSFNLIDGVDGLAGSLGLLTAVVFGSYFTYAGLTLYAVIAFSLAGSLVGFLIFNFSPAKIFMGDTGSLLIGLVNSIMVIKFINTAGNEAMPMALQSAPALGIAILMVPLFDTLRVFSLRILDRRSPFSPDRTHVHHLLLDIGFSHRSVTLLCVGTNVAFILLAFVLRELGTTVVTGLLTTIGISLITLIYYRRNRVKFPKVIKFRREQKILPSHKILSLAPETVEVD